MARVLLHVLQLPEAPGQRAAVREGGTRVLLSLLPQELRAPGNWIRHRGQLSDIGTSFD